MVSCALPIDPDFRDLGGPRLEGEPTTTWLTRRIFRQWLWRGIIGAAADDWGRFKLNPSLIASILMSNVRPEQWLLDEIAAGLKEYEALNWFYAYGPDQARVASIWSWFAWNSLKHAKQSKLPGMPYDTALTEGTRRGLPSHRFACGGMCAEEFAALHSWNGSMRGLRERQADNDVALTAGERRTLDWVRRDSGRESP
jgi:hypothetical protein